MCIIPAGQDEQLPLWIPIDKITGLSIDKSDAVREMETHEVIEADGEYCLMLCVGEVCYVLASGDDAADMEIKAKAFVLSLGFVVSHHYNGSV